MQGKKTHFINQPSEPPQVEEESKVGMELNLSESSAAVAIPAKHETKPDNSIKQMRDNDDHLDNELEDPPNQQSSSNQTVSQHSKS